MLNTATSVLALLSKIEAKSADRQPFFHEEVRLSKSKLTTKINQANGNLLTLAN